LCIYFLLLDSDSISDIQIVRSLLYCFQGIDSQFIVFNQNENQFVVLAKVSLSYTSKLNTIYVNCLRFNFF